MAFDLDFDLAKLWPLLDPSNMWGDKVSEDR